MTFDWRDIPWAFFLFLAVLAAFYDYTPTQEMIKASYAVGCLYLADRFHSMKEKEKNESKRNI